MSAIRKKQLRGMIAEIRAALLDIYGARLRGLVLYGSYARGQATGGSDLDLAVILDDFADVGEELEQMGEVGSRLSLRHDLTITFMPLRERDYRERQTPFLLNLRREGVAA